MNVAQETLGFRRAGLSPALSLLMSAFALPIPPASLSGHLRRRTERSSTTAANPSSTLFSASHLSDCLVRVRFATRARLRARSSQNEVDGLNVLEWICSDPQLR